MQVRGFLVTLVVSVIAGWVFDSVGMFLPWLLGPLLSILILKSIFTNQKWYWPTFLRNIGILILGIQLGSSFTLQAVKMMAEQLPFMIINTILVIGFTIGFSFLLPRLTSLNNSTALLGSFPGGLSQMVIIGEEIDEVDEAVVAFMQTIRVIMVITIVPWLLYHVVGDSTISAVTVTPISDTFWPSFDTNALLWLVVVLPLLIWGALKLKLPVTVPFLIVPIFVVALLNINGFQQTVLPSAWVDGAQLLFSAHLGVKMKIQKELFSVKLFTVVFVSNVCLIGFCIFLADILYVFFTLPFNEMFLSTAPGGVAEMAVTALSVGADVSVVTSYHLFRLFSILLIVTPVMKWWLIRRRRILRE